MELWSNGMMGLKEFFIIKMFYFRLYPQYSSIPTFHYSIIPIGVKPLSSIYLSEKLIQILGIMHSALLDLLRPAK
jgi:hypothetical protein